MRMILIAATILLSGLANAVEMTAEKTLTDRATLVTSVRNDQRTYCMKPRSNTPAQCNADFDDAVAKIAEATAWQILYLVSQKKQPESSKTLELYSDFLASRQNGLDALKKLERFYYPLPATTGQAPATSKK